MLHRTGTAVICLLAACLAAGASAAVAQAGERGVSFRPPPGALIAPGEAPDLFMLFTGDVLGYVDACG